MASPGGACSSGSSSLQNSGSELDRDVTDERKRKRMLSNRESARRSRMRKQQHLEGLSAQLEQLKKENNQINTSICMTTQLYANVEAENAILRAQMAELTNRLNSLNDIIGFINSTNYLMVDDNTNFNDCGGFTTDAWNSVPLNQPIMASVSDMFMY